MYDADGLARLSAGRCAVQAKFISLREAFTWRGYQNGHAKEHAQHGFGRRLGTLAQCIDRVFEILPPDLADIPIKERTVDATINIQAFTFNIFGCLENLAWIWVYEKNVVQADGQPLERTMVGLGPKYRHVRRSFTDGFKNYLQSRQDWFDHIKDFRDSLSHRIPLYIPPYIVPEGNADEYRQLEDASFQAVLRGAIDESDRLRAQQMGLVNFQPVMTHSFFEQAPTIGFHPQLLQDFNTVHEIGSELLLEMDR